MKCDIAKKCGSCQFINQGYVKSLEYKNEECKKIFKDLKVNVHPVSGMEDPYYYRNKTIIAFDKTYNYGLYEENSHRIIPYKSCLIHDQETDAIISKIAVLFRKYRVSIYDPQRRRGEIRHILIRRAVKTNQTLVVIVSNEAIFKGSKNFCNQLVKAFPSIKSIVLNTNKRQTSIVLGEQEKVLFGKGFIVDELCGMTFKISPRSFYQINHDQCEALYSKALSLITVKDPKIMDTYCGIGTIGLIASKNAKQVIGVELNKDAVKDAKLNKTFNKVENIKFIQGDATEFMVEAAKQKVDVDVIIMDPPRSGSTETFIKAAVSLKPQEIVYVSCDPHTQVRDLKLFRKLGYDFKDVYPYDMFPFTSDVETVCLLSKLHEAKHHVNVTVDMDEIDLTAAESKATYEEIKKYVVEHNDGMKVSSLNIAQVKAKYGIIERENYNLPKSGDAKQPQCPKEKEDAIEEALKAFKMI
mgnify:CR=1 FL=1